MVRKMVEARKVNVPSLREMSAYTSQRRLANKRSVFPKKRLPFGRGGKVASPDVTFLYERKTRMTVANMKTRMAGTPSSFVRPIFELRVRGAQTRRSERRGWEV